MGSAGHWLQVRLSERNIVELVNKLQQLGFLGDDLLHTINGKEYLTTDHLCRQVAEAVADAGGRVAVVSSHTSLQMRWVSGRHVIGIC